MTESVRRNECDLDRLGYGVPELARGYGLSTGFIRLEILRKRLKAHRLGRRWLVLQKDWLAYLEERLG